MSRSRTLAAAFTLVAFAAGPMGCGATSRDRNPSPNPSPSPLLISHARPALFTDRGRTLRDTNGEPHLSGRLSLRSA